MRYLFIPFLLLVLILWSSCRNDFESEPSTGNLQFSTDTLFLDTVFTNIGSSTYSFKVYNHTNDDFTIPSIALERGKNSNYRLNVDGIPGQSFENIQVLAKDSIFVFVETTTNITDQTADIEFLYTDRVLFDPSGNQQDVDLVTLIKDASFLFPSRDAMTGKPETLLLGLDDENNEIRIEGFFLKDEQLNFTNEKPYVIYGYAAVPSGKTLTIDAGVRVHFHANSGIIVANGGTLAINGELSTDPELLENEVIFEGDRLEPGFSDLPGQWGTIWLTAGSTGHTINHTTIKNATVGILMDSNDGGTDPTLTIKNSQIYNSSNVGLLARTGTILGENLVINNAGQVSLNCSLGGSYNFDHCTFTNYSSIGSGFRELPTVLIDNNLKVNETDVVVADLIEANFSNCIIYGNQELELLFSKIEGTAFNYNFKNCLIRFNDTGDQFNGNSLYDFTNTDLFENVILNEEPEFKTPFKNILNISENSAANGKASTPTMGTDILGVPRNATAPDIGAYESAVFEEGN
ncbi:right-handed parallel beta-helix repeat-containing protein [Aquimarina sediminis]|uniref:right-handed parallel beta-helix repeat-containing protein n=1 Tax=Aquimarina sediminis TaxID=2070536 RepID=UPI000CA01A14|nr:right-handed parallel beta-helix repeat-containing protein [Aquimarina sediminis]